MGERVKRQVDQLLGFLADPRDKPPGWELLCAAPAAPHREIVPAEVLEAMALEGGASRGDVEAILQLMGGSTAGAGSGPVPASAPAGRCGLTPREAEVLRLVAAGMTNREIATTLCVSPHTVKRHLGNVFEKAGLSSRAQAVALALRAGIA